MSAKLPRITSAQLLRALQRDNWEIIRQRGSHIQLKHPNKPGRLTVAHHSGATIKPKTLSKILVQADLTDDELRRLL